MSYIGYHDVLYRISRYRLYRVSCYSVSDITMSYIDDISSYCLYKIELESKTLLPRIVSHKVALCIEAGVFMSRCAELCLFDHVEVNDTHR